MVYPSKHCREIRRKAKVFCLNIFLNVVRGFNIGMNKPLVNSSFSFQTSSSNDFDYSINYPEYGSQVEVAPAKKEHTIESWIIIGGLIKKNDSKNFRNKNFQIIKIIQIKSKKYIAFKVDRVLRILFYCI